MSNGGSSTRLSRSRLELDNLWERGWAVVAVVAVVAVARTCTFLKWFLKLMR